MRKQVGVYCRNTRNFVAERKKNSPHISEREKKLITPRVIYNVICLKTLLCKCSTIQAPIQGKAEGKISQDVVGSWLEFG